MLCLVLDSSATRLFTGCGDSIIYAWDLEHHLDLGTLEGHCDAVNALAISGDAKMICSGSSDKTVIVWDLSSRERLAVLQGHSQ